MNTKLIYGGVGVLVVILVAAGVWMMGAGKTRQTATDTSESVPLASDSVGGTPSSSSSSSSSASDCKTAPVVPLPVAKASIESILYPGQTRGGNYKPHGGFRLANGQNATQVTLPLDAKLIAGARYYEMGEVQYMFDFETDCKFRMRFDHLLTLSPELQAEAEKLPAPKPDDSRTTNLSGKEFKAGAVLATHVGFVKTGNAAFDFGLYDYNQKNKMSQDASWLADPQHQFENAQHAVCWLDYLKSEDKAEIKALPAGDGAMGKTSDYCL